MKVENAVVDCIDEKNRTYHLILDFGANKPKVRLYCREGDSNNERTNEPTNTPTIYSVEFMGERCPCCHGCGCNCLFTKREKYLKEVHELPDFRLKVQTGLSLVF
ncbi:hypothetical protein [Priestia aryabhattai]